MHLDLRRGRGHVRLGHGALILADVYVAELGLVGVGSGSRSHRQLCGLRTSRDPGRFRFDHLSAGRRIPDEHVERGRIGCAGSGEALVPAP